MRDFDFIQKYNRVLIELSSLIKKTNKHAVLIIQQRPNEQDVDPIVPMVRESLSNIIAFVCIAQSDIIEYVVREAKGIVDTIILDNVIKRSNSDSIIKALYVHAAQYEIPVLTYNDFDSWATSAVNLIKANDCSSLTGKDVLVVGKNYLATRMILQLIDCNANIYLLESDYETMDVPYINTTNLSIHSPNVKYVDTKCNFDILLGCCLHSQCDKLDMLCVFDFDAIYDVGVSNFDQQFIATHKAKGCNTMFRSDDRAGIASVVLNLMETNYLLQHCVGRKSLPGINMVAGGLIGYYGDVVVDSMENPRQVLGVANGDGTFKQDLTEKDKNNIEKVKTILS